MTEPLRAATRELRWELIQTAIADLLQAGTIPITATEVARRCDIPKSAFSREPDWKAAIAAAEAERVRRQAEKLQQLRVGFFVEPEADGEARRVTPDSLKRDLETLLAQASLEAQAAHQRGLEEGRQQAPAPVSIPGPDPAMIEARVTAAYEAGRLAGREELSEDLNQAYERGVKDGKADGGDAQAAYDRGRQMGRAELQVELKAAFDNGYKEGKSEAAADVMNAYDRGRHDGWEEGRREGTSNGRGMFGFAINKANPDREWALAVLHAPSNASLDTLRQSYRMLTKAYHPDRNPDLSPEFIRNLNRAKEVLGF